ncbi:MAG: hypothetical protein ACXWXV_02970 [Aeromicrobium sp.]
MNCRAVLITALVAIALGVIFRKIRQSDEVCTPSSDDRWDPELADAMASELKIDDQWKDPAL